MENKEKEPDLKAPAEANRGKHMNYLAAEERSTGTYANSNGDNKEDEEDKQTSREGIRDKHDADSGNDGSTKPNVAARKFDRPGQ